MGIVFVLGILWDRVAYTSIGRALGKVKNDGNYQRYFSYFISSGLSLLIGVAYYPFHFICLSLGSTFVAHSAFITAYHGVRLVTLQPDGLVHGSVSTGLVGCLGRGIGIGWHGMHMSIHISGIS